MMQVSENAKVFLRSALDSGENVPGSIFRLIEEEEQLALKLASAEEGDVVYEQSGVPVLATAPGVAERLDSKTIDLEQTAEGARLVLTE